MCTSTLTIMAAAIWGNLTRLLFCFGLSEGNELECSEWNIQRTGFDVTIFGIPNHNVSKNAVMVTGVGRWVLAISLPLQTEGDNKAAVWPCLVTGVVSASLALTGPNCVMFL